ncbi:MAG: hypothetical protein ISR78_00450 [Spirochaetia bacterium]|nr:hypothetical protein [Spirochaetia bacterium]
MVDKKAFRFLIFLSLCIWLPPSVLSAEKPGTFPEPDLLKEKTFYQLPQNLNCPETIEAEVLQWIGTEGITLGSEFLYTVKGVLSYATMLDVCNGLLGYSSMKGLTYYSTRDKGIKTLIEDSYRVSGPENRKPLPDLQLEELVSETRIFVQQKIRDFGEVLWEIQYRYTGESVFVYLTNYKPIYFGIFKIIEAAQFSVMLAAVPNKDDIIIYQIGKVKSVGLQILSSLGFGADLEKSFYHRMKALRYAYSSTNFTY